MHSATIIGHGWLGKLLSYQLIKKGYSCYVSSRSIQAAAAGILPFSLNLPQDSIPEAVLTSPLFFFCLAPGKDPGQYLLALEKACYELQKKNPDACLAFCSSISVYNSAGICSENSPVDASHILYRAEEMVRSKMSSHLIFRLGGLYGEGRNPAHFFRSGLATGAAHYTNLVKGEYAAAAMVFLGMSKQTGTFNIADNGHLQKARFYNDLREKENLSPLVFKETEVPLKVVSIAKLQAAGFS